MTEANSFLQFTDADLRVAMRRALKTIVFLAVVLAAILSLTAGWQTAVLLLVGALIAATGLYEWHQLISLINARLDNARPARPAAWVVTMFLLRLLLAAAILYASLRCLHGSVYALIGGIGLAVLALSIEAVRLVRS